MGWLTDLAGLTIFTFLAFATWNTWQTLHPLTTPPCCHFLLGVVNWRAYVGPTKAWKTEAKLYTFQPRGSRLSKRTKWKKLLVIKRLKNKNYTPLSIWHQLLFVLMEILHQLGRCHSTSITLHKQRKVALHFRYCITFGMP